MGTFSRIILRYIFPIKTEALGSHYYTPEWFQSKLHLSHLISGKGCDAIKRASNFFFHFFAMMHDKDCQASDANKQASNHLFPFSALDADAQNNEDIKQPFPHSAIDCEDRWQIAMKVIVNGCM